MKDLKVTKEEVRKCLDVKRIILNLIIYFLIYAIVTSILLPLMLNFIIDLMVWAFITGFMSVFFLIFEIANVIRLAYMLNSYKKLPAYKVKLDKVNYYLNKKIPVFACPIQTKLGTILVETNAIYKLKQVPLYKGHLAKVLYDQKKNRIYIITLLD
ncbi:MAG: hypothetical protein SPJ17_06700 [Anaeroplasma sp.]|uniref:hypothetical protein n=1 Tax=Anaeroplasma sp. TaxID=1872523 RepID=UPI002A9152C9|nr:hypothetical protein [Anaeroplasma sp.]MDY5983370.1 hypothetical protein [Anaeroplasma sp.]